MATGVAQQFVNAPWPQRITMARDTLPVERTGQAVDITALLAQSEWLRRLARQLARDDDLAVDAVQDTWEAALRSPPAPDRPARPWLLTVLRNALRKRARTDSRRWQREQTTLSNVAAGECVPGEEARERAEMQQAVTAMVLALAEP